jgi:hypothetical protein
MNGTITFDNISDLAEFLKDFAGSTAIFKVEKHNETKWVLTFTGGY